MVRLTLVATVNMSKNRTNASPISGIFATRALANQPVIPPSEEEFYPALESLRWREKHLNAKY